jgi:hypothetical protein
MHIQPILKPSPRRAPLLTAQEIAVLAVLAVVGGLALGYITCLWHHAMQQSSAGKVVLCQSKP